MYRIHILYVLVFLAYLSHTFLCTQLHGQCAGMRVVYSTVTHLLDSTVLYTYILKIIIAGGREREREEKRS